MTPDPKEDPPELEPADAMDVIQTTASDPVELIGLPSEGFHTEAFLGSRELEEIDEDD